MAQVYIENKRSGAFAYKYSLDLVRSNETTTPNEGSKQAE